MPGRLTTGHTVRDTHTSYIVSAHFDYYNQSALFFLLD
jgi:hypothetical protein